MGEENVYWLDEWRRRRDERKNLVIPMTAEPFGGTGTISPSELCEYMTEFSPCVAIFINGNFKNRLKVHKWLDLFDGLDGFSYEVVSETDLAIRNQHDIGTPLGVLESAKVMTNSLIREGENVLLDLGSYWLENQVSSLASVFFYNGARTVVVIDPTGDYGDWEKDGITGSIWTDWWDEPEDADPQW